MGSKAVPFMLEQIEKNSTDGVIDARSPESAAIIGFVGQNYIFTPLVLLRNKTNFKHRMPKVETLWWLPLRILMRNLAKNYKFHYLGEAERRLSSGSDDSPVKISISFD